MTANHGTLNWIRRVANYVIRRYGLYYHDYEEIYATAYLAYVEAMASYDPSSKMKPDIWADQKIRWNILDYCRFIDGDKRRDNYMNHNSFREIIDDIDAPSESESIEDAIYVREAVETLPVPILIKKAIVMRCHGNEWQHAAKCLGMRPDRLCQLVRQYEPAIRKHLQAA